MPTLQSLFSLYIDCSRLRESSIEIKKRALSFFIKLYPDITAEEVTFGHVEDYVNHIARSLKGSSVNIYLANLRPFFAWLVRRGYLSVNPVEVKRLPVEHKRRAIYSIDEIERIVRVADPLWRIYVALGICGLRRAEAQNLHATDIDFEHAYLHIRGKEQTDRTWQWQVKDHQSAITPLPERMAIGDIELDLHTLLCDRINTVGPAQPYIMLAPGCYRRMLERQSAGTLTHYHRNCPYQNFSRAFRSLLKRACVKAKRFQDLRVTFANAMFKGGMSLQKTQRLMRHSSSQTTLDYYLDIDEEKTVSDAANLLENIMGHIVP